MGIDPYLDLCLIDTEDAVLHSLDADPHSVLYRDIVPPSLLKDNSAGVGFGLLGDSSQPKACFVQGLPWWVHDMDVERSLGEVGVGDVGAVRFLEHPINGRSKGTALVRFHSPAAAKACEEKYKSYTDTYGEHTLRVQLVSEDRIGKDEDGAPIISSAGGEDRTNVVAAALEKIRAGEGSRNAPVPPPSLGAQGGTIPAVQPSHSFMDLIRQQGSLQQPQHGMVQRGAGGAPASPAPPAGAPAFQGTLSPEHLEIIRRMARTGGSAGGQKRPTPTGFPESPSKVAR